MTTFNDITGDPLRSRTSTKDFDENYDKIFRKEPMECPAEDKQQVPLVVSPTIH